ncbi:hypothetical protein [Alistipes senegalensis]|uniref:hypothetical protein n=1 Tax=Alistipes senegalensis TaxID=1288121 RepID=UPI0018AA2DAC|nr:hypothetical protein [Alistipes senegalensis]
MYGWDTSHFAAPRSVGAPVSIVNADLVHEIGFYAGAGLFVPKKVGETDYLHVGVGQHRHRLVCRLDSCDNRKSRQQHVRG